MTLFSVSEAKNRWLQERMTLLGIREEDLEEKFIRSSGKGGQHVNKTSTCVWLKHLPTGIEVKCMAERSQSLNRFLARRELAEKLVGGKFRRDFHRDDAHRSDPHDRADLQGAPRPG